MVSSLLHVGAIILCPHGGQVSLMTSNSRVFVSRQPVVTQNDTSIIAGCTYAIPSYSPHPCVLVKWFIPATRVFMKSQPVILQNSVGMCQSADQSTQGPPNIVSLQCRVKGT